MADEFDLDQLDSEIEQKNKVELRIKNLSDKVKLTSEERDDKDRLLQEQRSQNESLVKERDFLNSFGDQAVKYPDALAFKDKIKEKVLKGYSVEDATTAVLVSEGKYSAPRVETPITASPVNTFAGGSAPTLHQAGGEKGLDQLSREEKRAKLVEAEQRGDLGVK